VETGNIQWEVRKKEIKVMIKEVNNNEREEGIEHTLLGTELIGLQSRS
jgi:hypothetical protein